MSRDCHGLVIPPVRVAENRPSGHFDHARRDANQSVSICLPGFSAGRDEIADTIPASLKFAGAAFQRGSKLHAENTFPANS
jgi:hypothetical protein